MKFLFSAMIHPRLRHQMTIMVADVGMILTKSPGVVGAVVGFGLVARLMEFVVFTH
eukprot:SAG31_NODE_174_length_21353_cov_23.387974_13_plen_56_part_00